MEESNDSGLSDLAELFGKRGCCKKNNCIHRKAVFAVNRIAFLEGEVKGLRERIKAAENCLVCIAIADPAEVAENTLKILKGADDANNNESESGS